MGIFSSIKRKTNNKSIFCGLDNSGKTTIISFLKEGCFIEHTPTLGKTKQEFEVQGTKLTMFDMGGQSSFRKLWLGELTKDTKVVVFVIDRTAVNRFDEAKAELEVLIPIIKKENIKLLILANKSDLPTAAPIDILYDKLRLSDFDSFEFVEISAKTGYGMADAFIKFYSALTGSQLKKNVVASAVSIYNKGGVPLISKARNDEQLNNDVIQGGFLSAITSFANMKMGNTSVKFESDKTGTFIIKSSLNFIGALLWNPRLSIPIEESEESLNELLNHLECMVEKDDPEMVSFYVTQYCTNMM